MNKSYLKKKIRYIILVKKRTIITFKILDDMLSKKKNLDDKKLK